jgi:hypothetical protein
MHIALIHAIGRKLANFKERRAGIKQPFDAVSRQQLSACNMAFAMLFRPAKRGRGHFGTQICSQGAIM